MNILLKPLYHRGRENIAICYENNIAINNVVKKLKYAKWSQTHRCWYAPMNEASYKLITGALKTMGTIENSLLRHYLEKRKQVEATRSNPDKTELKRKAVAIRKRSAATPAWKLSAENLEALNRFVEQLKLKAYSASTIRTYRNEFMQLLQVIKNKPVYDLTAEELRRYFVYCHEKLALRENTVHSRLNAVKFYFEQVLKREKFFWEIPRPKKPCILPKLLNETELARLFNALYNKKHKAMLFTAYSAGLRVSEIVNLKIADIDSKRMQIFVERAKGKKDRYVNLSPVLVDILRSYLKNHKPRPQVFLFESDYTKKAYPTRTVQQIFANAKAKAGITKDVGIHSLRHSFATHLLEKGTDIRYIKELLGHFNIKTTERYLHVAKQKLVNIISPLDDLVEKEKIDW